MAIPPPEADPPVTPTCLRVRPADLRFLALLGAAILTTGSRPVTGPCGAATLLDLPPSTLRNRMKKLGIPRASHHIR